MKKQIQASTKKHNEVFVLGAGSPQVGKQHTALRSAFGTSRVLDWFIKAVKPLQSKITFIGGYQIDEVKEKYTEFDYLLNADWESTGAAYSFLMGLHEKPSNSCMVFYSDILFRESLVEAISGVDADISIAIDSHWEKRFSGRTQKDIKRTEKVLFKDYAVTSLGEGVALDMADAEFVGCVHFGENALKRINTDSAFLNERMKQASLSTLIEYLRLKGLIVKAVDVKGDWAELNEPKDLAHFILGTKAQTLYRLQTMVSSSVIEKQVSFTVKSWDTDSELVLQEIKNNFDTKSLVVRSSALSEDGFTHSNAGAYTSLLNVDGSNASLVKKAITEVIDSYPDDNYENQVLVQPMLQDVIVSGVVFTRTLSHHSPYYFFNYDDSTGSTESITSGTAKKHKTVVIRRDASPENVNIPENIKKLIPALHEIESLLNYDSLDIEFAITKGGRIHILQVRPIVVTKNTASQVCDKDLITKVKQAEKKFTNLQETNPFVFGDKTMFGIMPDWNPAEIIGTKPRPLATSLYKHLIMDEIWATQRAEYGYKDVRPQNLLQTFMGRPYVNITASFSSFIPQSIDPELANKLVNFYLSFLEKNPHLHDKIEFDVVPTCYSLDFHRWESRLTEEGGFSKKETDLLRMALLEVTNNAIKRNASDLQGISVLESRYQTIRENQSDALDLAYMLLIDGKRYGTLPFAHLARSAFVAMTLLRSAVVEEVISQEEYDEFINSIRTVSHSFTDDAKRTVAEEMPWDIFIDKYGHLRPGTYDITSPNYAQDPERYLKPVLESAKKSLQDDAVPAEGLLWKSALPRMVEALNQRGLKCEASEFDVFLREAIEGREYAKFAFTKNLSSALDLIEEWGDRNELNADSLSYLTHHDIFAFRNKPSLSKKQAKRLRMKIKASKRNHKITAAAELPALLSKLDDFSVFVYPQSQANFVGQSVVVGACVDLSSDNEADDLEGKIVMVPQADPGYDWLFGRNIGALITMYGGANSHMAIRSAEFGLSAAIGVGETLYEELCKVESLELDPVNRTIRVVC